MGHIAHRDSERVGGMVRVGHIAHAQNPHRYEANPAYCQTRSISAVPSPTTASLTWRGVNPPIESNSSFTHSPFP